MRRLFIYCLLCLMPLRLWAAAVMPVAEAVAMSGSHTSPVALPPAVMAHGDLASHGMQPDAHPNEHAVGHPDLLPAGDPDDHHVGQVVGQGRHALHHASADPKMGEMGSLASLDKPTEPGTAKPMSMSMRSLPADGCCDASAVDADLAGAACQHGSCHLCGACHPSASPLALVANLALSASQALPPQPLGFFGSLALPPLVKPPIS